MNRNYRQTFAILWMLIPLFTGGCATDSPAIQNVITMPSSFETWTCQDLLRSYENTLPRFNELALLREKSGNPIANAIAYDTEFATAQANLDAIRTAASQKGCDLAPSKPPEPAVISSKSKKPSQQKR